MSKKGVLLAHVNWVANEEFFHCQPAAIQNSLLYNKPRAALETGPEVTDNPLFEGIHPEECKQRYAPPRLSLEESRFKPIARRGSLSLSAKDYEGIWRAVEEDVSKSTSDSKSPVEDFNEFRQKLAQLKHDMAGPTSGRTGVTSSASVRSAVGTLPSRPTSPLKRLSVITSRRIATSGGLKPHLGPHQRVPPSVQKLAVTVRAESLFNLPNPASISPAPSQSDPAHTDTPPVRGCAPVNRRRSNVESSRVDRTSSAEVLSSKSTKLLEKREPPKGFEVRGTSEGYQATVEDVGTEDKHDDPEKSGEAQARVQVQTGVESRAQHSKRWGSDSSTTSGEIEDASQSSASTRRLPVPCGGPRQPKSSTQQEQAKKGIACSRKDRKVRCMSIPRPVCYSVSIID